MPNSYFDHVRGAEDYNYYLDEYVRAEELGFDGVALNEHHGNPFCMGSVMNVEAAILARITNRVKILLIGNPLPVIKHPLRMAEELATIDLISRGRLVTGWVRGAGSEQFFNNANPAYNREMFEEAHDFIVQAWTRPGPVALRGEALPLPAREPVGAAVPEAPSADDHPGRAVARDGPLERGEGVPVHRSRHVARADGRPVGPLRRRRRQRPAIKRGRRTSATSSRPSWPTPTRRRRSSARGSSSAVARPCSAGPSTPCRRATTRRKPSVACPSSREARGSASTATS